MQTTTPDVAVTANEHDSPLLVERLLRQPESLWHDVAAERDLGRLNRGLAWTTSVSLALYGVVLGASSSLTQALASAVKLPVLFLLTLAICLPALYLFNLVFGSRLRASQTLAVVLSAIATTSVLALGFAPISVFFLLSTPGYGFFKLLNVTILALTGLAGLRVLLGGMRHLEATTPRSRPTAVHTAATREAPDTAESGETPATRAADNQGLLHAWIVLYGFVGTQLAWTLRPFFGAPDLPFELFRELEGNFYVNVIVTFLNLFR